MPSDFVDGRAGPPKRLADLIAQLHREDGGGPRPAHRTDPVREDVRMAPVRRARNRESAEARRKRLAQEAVETVRKSDPKGRSR